ncbi:hypothetical protein A2634_02975 [Candidatus Amesbacteria bacterium RIFCSPHIGHO2_01_FULL_48_32]|uniref:Uncharacterized protein n=1 Tax=Candidatus Amesbacteria bacterium RIFCSPLOWO2_01_FULL_48_25 TaxID=1797259 RepID=A0A1F4ZCH2_9BACT|nr:MAG: hypothetical protein A2634_02975 [Candidatus Amesbacteria bacterium RIFCSPHIGHO2_01_FULL_48_32]OGD03104.1 MAG: hypothetical protein A2989_02195 [Candidatus Amesbacteria bacterium RIFCSPLOWO2_01_FULL_48_25]
MFQILGPIDNPYCSGLSSGLCTTGTGAGLYLILNSLVKFVIVIAGLYAFVNLITAGYTFISAGSEPKNVAKAWERIWQSLVGLLVVAGSFVLAGIFGWIIFGDVRALFTLRYFTP